MAPPEKKRLIDGLDIAITSNALDDMELLEDLIDLQNGDHAKLSSVLTQLLGSREKKQKLYDHLRRDGKVHVSDVSVALQELIEAADKKN